MLFDLLKQAQSLETDTRFMPSVEVEFNSFGSFVFKMNGKLKFDAQTEDEFIFKLKKFIAENDKE